MLTTLLPFLTAFLFSAIAVPSIIKLAYHKRLVDDPNKESRKIHKHSIPNLGGVAVFSTFTLVSCLFVNMNMLPQANFIFAAGIIVFSIGLKDDLIALDPYKKFIAQFIAAFIVVYCANIRFTNFYGVLSIYEISPALSYIFTSFFIVFIINAFNLIDGINGLLGSLSFMVTATYGTLFYLMDQGGLSALSFSMAGAILGFLRFNFGKRARIFMGDAGAYSIGFIIALLSVQLIEIERQNPLYELNAFMDTPALVLAVLIMPIFDTLRVFFIRILKGKSPFYPDRKHLHHRLLDLGLNHTQATLTITITNILMVVLAFSLNQQVATAELMLIIFFATIFCNAMLWLYEVRNFPGVQESLIPPAAPSIVPLEQLNTTIANNTKLGDIISLDKERFTQEVLDNLEKSKN